MPHYCGSKAKYGLDPFWHCNLPEGALQITAIYTVKSHTLESIAGRCRLLDASLIQWDVQVALRKKDTQAAALDQTWTAMTLLRFLLPDDEKAPLDGW